MYKLIICTADVDCTAAYYTAMKTIKSTTIKPSSPVELAKLYGVCDKTFKKWLKPFEAAIGERIGRYYSIAQVRIIFEKLGEPGEG